MSDTKPCNSSSSFEMSVAAWELLSRQDRVRRIEVTRTVAERVFVSVEAGIESSHEQNVRVSRIWSLYYVLICRNNIP